MISHKTIPNNFINITIKLLIKQNKLLLLFEKEKS